MAFKLLCETQLHWNPNREPQTQQPRAGMIHRKEGLLGRQRQVTWPRGIFSFLVITNNFVIESNAWEGSFFEHSCSGLSSLTEQKHTHTRLLGRFGGLNSSFLFSPTQSANLCKTQSTHKCIIKVSIKARQWCCTPLTPALRRQRQADFWVRGQPGLQSEFQDSQSYTEKPCLRKKQQKKVNIKKHLICSRRVL